MKNFLALLCFCLPLAGLTQTINNESLFKTRNTVYLEALGTGGLYSVNYERLLSLKEKQIHGFRVGTSYFKDPSIRFVNLIGELFIITAKGNHHGDFGIGLTGFMVTDFDRSGPVSSYTLGAVPRLSYRYQKPVGGLMLRVGFTPLITISKADDSALLPWFGLAIGHSF